MARKPRSHAAEDEAQLNPSAEPTPAHALQGIQLIVFDVDGVLTDGGIIMDDRGVESKRFHVRDGFAIRAAMSVGLKVGILTGRSSQCVSLRAAELGLDLLMQGVKEKGSGFETLCQRAGVEPQQAAYMGDDLVDLPAMLRAGYSFAVADAAEEVRSVASHVTKAKGGDAAAREAIEHVLHAQGQWDKIRERYGI